MKNKIILAIIIGSMSLSFSSHAKDRAAVDPGTKEVVVGLALLFCPMCLIPVMEELDKVKEAPKAAPKVVERSLASDKAKQKK